MTVNIFHLARDAGGDDRDQFAKKGDCDGGSNVNLRTALTVAVNRHITSVSSQRE